MKYLTSALLAIGILIFGGSDYVTAGKSFKPPKNVCYLISTQPGYLPGSFTDHLLVLSFKKGMMIKDQNNSFPIYSVAGGISERTVFNDEVGPLFLMSGVAQVAYSNSYSYITAAITGILYIESVTCRYYTRDSYQGEAYLSCQKIGPEGEVTLRNYGLSERDCRLDDLDLSSKNNR